METKDSIQNKIDFAVIISVTDANPNGDPLNGNIPRNNVTDSGDVYGEISDVCIKRKIRNRLQEMGEKIFVQSDDHYHLENSDEYDSLQSRAENNEKLQGVVNSNKSKKSKEKNRILYIKSYTEAACEQWIDVRAFGQVFAFESTSVGVRGPVSISIAKSVSPIDIISMQITKSVNGESGKSEKSSDTMGAKNRVEFGLYVVKGSINCQLAEKTGFSDEDAEKIKKALETLFENDCSSARPEGSMEVCRGYWWKHNSKTPAVSTAKVHRSVKITEKEGLKHKPRSFDDYDITLEKIEGLVEPEIFGDM